jgi:hypothetical protein
MRVDEALGLTSQWTPALMWSALSIGIAGGIVNLLLRRPTLCGEGLTARGHSWGHSGARLSVTGSAS